ncbi:Uncharacterised protein [Candidatus Gugararchaeum adminiculabundum]|nr:Uncharacterised protein [Candidatus Gugararchaeum adminiculabundum]
MMHLPEDSNLPSGLRGRKPLAPPSSYQIPKSAAPISKPPREEAAPAPEYKAPEPRPAPAPTYSRPAPAPRMSEDGEGGVGSKLPLILSGLALLLAVVALAMVFMGAGGGISKAELKGIVSDLKAMKDKSIELNTPLQGTVELATSVPAANAMPAKFDLEVPYTLPIDTTITVNLPGVGVSQVPFKGSASGTMKLSIDARTAAAGKTIDVKYSIPISSNVNAVVKTGNVWGTELDDIISRLEKASN